MTAAMPAPLDVKLMNMTASVLFVGCALLVLAAGAWWVMRYPGFAIARIVVHGDLVHNNAVTLRANVGPRLAGNFFTTPWRIGARTLARRWSTARAKYLKRTWAMSSRKTCRACQAPKALRKRYWPCTVWWPRCSKPWGWSWKSWS